MESVIIKCGYRVHINSIDMNGFSGRCCGGLGFSVKDLELCTEVSKSKTDIILGLYEEKTKKILNKVREEYQIKDKFKIELKNEAREHIGMGSETLLTLSIAVAILKLCNIKFKIPEIAKKLKLAGVSGISYGTFMYGNFVVDSGYILGENKPDFVSHSTIPPQILLNINIPDNWKVILFTPKNISSISQEEEDKFFEMYTPVPIDEVKNITYHTFMGVIPAIKENDFENFIKNLKIVTVLGTKKAELKINEKNTGSLLKKIEEDFGFAGLSSLGPTCYTFVDSNSKEVDIDLINKKYPDCEVIVTQVRNRPFDCIEANHED